MNGSAAAGFGLAVLLLLPILAVRAFAIGARRRRRAGGLPAPGDGHHPARAPHSPAPGNNPVPGTTTPQVTPRPPARPSPAPGHPEHGIRLLSADFYEDGTVLVHDHLHQRTTKFEAPEPGPGLDWDGWLEGMTP